MAKYSPRSMSRVLNISERHLPRLEDPPARDVPSFEGTPASYLPRLEDMDRLGQMLDIYWKLKYHWYASEFHEQQVNFIRSKILTIESLDINQALCVGIESLSNRRPRRLVRDRNLNRRPGAGRWRLDMGYDRRSLKGLCQLVIFECMLEVLLHQYIEKELTLPTGEKFDIKNNRIYFHFTRRLNTVERHFMVGLRHAHGCIYYFHDVKDVMTPQTFLFCTSKHTKYWHESLLQIAVPPLAVLAPLQVNGYWKNYSRGAQRVFRRFLNTVHSCKLGPLVDATSLDPQKRRKLQKELDTKESTELRMSNLLMNYEFYWRPDPDLTKEKEKPMYGWYTPMAWHQLPGPTGVSIRDVSDLQAIWVKRTMSWWNWLIQVLPWLIYLEIILRWIKKTIIDAFWPTSIQPAGAHGPVEAVWDSREEDSKVWYLVEMRTNKGTEWNWWRSEDLGTGAYEKVKDFHYATPDRAKGRVPMGWRDMAMMLLFRDPYVDYDND
ncbi:hypothetical protein NHQ30_005579 [Ciborinia camelliae]|nr:hypothetical protein NHQ30_005579 [Ciborinia camelliae]